MKHFKSIITLANNAFHYKQFHLHKLQFKKKAVLCWQHYPILMPTFQNARKQFWHCQILYRLLLPLNNSSWCLLSSLVFYFSLSLSFLFAVMLLLCISTAYQINGELLSPANQAWLLFICNNTAPANRDLISSKPRSRFVGKLSASVNRVKSGLRFLK